MKSTTEQKKKTTTLSKPNVNGKLHLIVWDEGGHQSNHDKSFDSPPYLNNQLKIRKHHWYDQKRNDLSKCSSQCSPNQSSSIRITIFIIPTHISLYVLATHTCGSIWASRFFSTTWRTIAFPLFARCCTARRIYRYLTFIRMQTQMIFSPAINSAVVRGKVVESARWSSYSIAELTSWH